MTNVSTVTGLVFLGFSEGSQELQLVYDMLFLLFYLAALKGDLVIIAVTVLDWHFRSPMYLFLRHLSFIDACYISIIVPKSILNSLTNNSLIYSKAIPFCKLCPFSELPWIVHRFYHNTTRITTVTRFLLLGFSEVRELQPVHSALFLLLVGAELVILTVMSYNPYVAICLPLCYDVTINRAACVKIAISSWLGAAPQFFCDASFLLMVSCSETQVIFNFSLASGFVCTSFSFVFFVTSYIRLCWAMLRMPTTEGRAKAVSTCLPHLAVLTVVLSMASIAYLKPPSD
ncbi:olfactory receptor 14A2-like [Tachyglossus aculeatus]|uniref:olfactory receptor 14A2-like n=1 Tax=Tachyglossus aculeatus TaxID=9261 RepID=UPI0018F7CED3|nr:olfactory receptor 14A2-like [Tachyglossus aculeatus]